MLDGKINNILSGSKTPLAGATGKNTLPKKVIIYGSETLSKMLFYDAIGNNNFIIAAFTVDNDYLQGHELLGLPLVSFQEIHDLFPPDEYDMLALFNGYSRMRDREKMYLKAKSTGYKLRNYISVRADIAPEIIMGDNNVIMGTTHIGFGGTMGNNNLIRQNVYLGHEFKLGNNNIITAGCNIGGHSEIENNCYIGLGVTVINHIKIEDESLIGAGSVVIRDTEPYSKNVGNPSHIIGYHQDEGVRMTVRE